AGAVRVVATGLRSNRRAVVMATVRVTAAVVAVSPTAAKPGALITLRGSHFLPYETVTIDLVALSTSSVLATIHATGQGAFAIGRIAVPATAPAGTLTVVATGLASHLSATTLLTVVPVAAVLAVSPATVTAGQSVRLVGSTFFPGETVTVQLCCESHVVPLPLAAV